MTPPSLLIQRAIPFNLTFESAKGTWVAELSVNELKVTKGHFTVRHNYSLRPSEKINHTLANMQAWMHRNMEHVQKNLTHPAEFSDYRATLTFTSMGTRYQFLGVFPVECEFLHMDVTEPLDMQLRTEFSYDELRQSDHVHYVG